MHKKGISLNSVEKSLSHSTEKIRRRILLYFERILVSKSFKQRRGEASRFCRNFFYLLGPKKLRQGTILCFRKFLVGKNILWIRGVGGGASRFSVEVFVSLYRNISLEHFGVSEKLFYRKFSRIGGGGGGITALSKFFVSQDRNEKLCKGTLVFRKLSGIEKNSWIREGISRFSVEIFMSHTAENFCNGILPFLRKFLDSKSFMDEKGGITFFSRKFLVSQCRKIS